MIKKKVVNQSSNIKLNMTFEEAMKKALSTPLKKSKARGGKVPNKPKK